MMKRNPKRTNLQCENNHDELIERAHQASGNWQRFESFGWSRAAELDKPRDWTIVYTHHRDSRLLDQSNAAVIQHALQRYLDEDNPDVLEEHHRHWAVGWIDGFAIRVFRNGKVTRAFRAYLELAQQLDEYPVLDEEDYSRREYEATLENFESASAGMQHQYELPEGWKEEVFSWLWEHDQQAVENRDDCGG